MLILPAVIQNLRTLADKSWRIQLDTQELSAELSAELMKLHQSFGWFAFSENPDDKIIIPSEPAPEFKADKSISERIRACLFVYWNECTSKKQPFRDFYESWGEKKISEIKHYLPEK